MIDKLLSKEQLDACEEAREWAAGKPWAEIYETCPRGDWLLWLFVRTNPDDVRLRVLIAGHCANTVRHLMTDPRSVAGVDAAIAFGEGRIDEAAEAAEAAYAAWAAWAAARAAEATWADAEEARSESQRQIADIVRKDAPIEIWNVEDEND